MVTGFKNKWAGRASLTTATTLAIVGPLLCAISAGCGSGGSGAASTVATTRAAATVNLYVTDAFSDDWSHVQVTLYKIEASTDNGTTYTTIFSNTTGQSVDLASLGSAAQLLSSATLPAGTITNVRVTTSDTVSLTKKSDGTVTTITVDNTLPNVTVANGQAVFTFAAATAMSPGHLANLVVDFKLAAFEIVAGKLRPSLGEAAPGTFNTKQDVAHVSGTISNYVAGTSFDLTPDCGQHGGPGNAGTPAVIHVTLNSSTAITFSSSTVTALANGVTVTVEGTADPTTQTIAATVVDAHDASTASTPNPTPVAGSVLLMGTVAALGTDGTSFTLTVRDGEHMPTTTTGTVTVQTSSTTTIDQGHTAATFSAITAGSYVFAVGTLDSTTGTLTANTVAVLPAPPTGASWPGPPPGGGH